MPTRVSTSVDCQEDLLTADEFLDWSEPVIEGAPDLVVEVTSVRTAYRDVGRKFVEYEQQRVGEYWVLDPRTLAHRFYRHTGEIFEEFADGEAQIASAIIPGLVVQREWLDPQKLPKVRDCLSVMQQ